MKIFPVNNGDKSLLPDGGSPTRPWWDKTVEQVVNSAIVGVMAFISTIIATQDWSVTWKAGLIAAGIAFLVEMRKYWPRKADQS